MTSWSSIRGRTQPALATPWHCPATFPADSSRPLCLEEIQPGCSLLEAMSVASWGVQEPWRPQGQMITCPTSEMAAHLLGGCHPVMHCCLCLTQSALLTENLKFIFSCRNDYDNPYTGSQDPSMNGTDDGVLQPVYLFVDMQTAFQVCTAIDRCCAKKRCSGCSWNAAALVSSVSACLHSLQILASPRAPTLLTAGVHCDHHSGESSDQECDHLCWLQ